MQVRYIYPAEALDVLRAEYSEAFKSNRVQSYRVQSYQVQSYQVHLPPADLAVYPRVMRTLPAVILKPREEDRLLRGHPWVFDNEIRSVNGTAESGAEVHVYSAQGRFLGTGLWSPVSKIRVRRYADTDTPFDAAFVASRLERAMALRSTCRNPDTDSSRAVFAEADGLPGLIVDRYVGTDDEGNKGSWLVTQFLSKGMDDRRELILAALDSAYRPAGIMERSEATVRRLEGLASRSAIVAGSVPEAVVITENGLRFKAEIGSGQKTGWFLDQPENRAAAAMHAIGRTVLDCFCNAGGFSLAAAAAGATLVRALDSSREATGSVQANAELNGLGSTIQTETADAFDYLRRAVQEGQQYGLVILDPPAFAKNKASLDGAARGYKEINLQALKLLQPGGILATFSCSYWLSRERFLAILEDAAKDAGTRIRYLAERGQAPDHPIVSGYPESRYLKGFIVEKTIF
jgi:23S rRNA (cytosine1962-C5)-methyltransferase